MINMHYEFNFAKVNYIDVYNSKIKDQKESSQAVKFVILTYVLYTFLYLLTFYDNQENNPLIF